MVVRGRWLEEYSVTYAKGKMERLWHVSLSYAEQRELKSLSVVGTGKLEVYQLSCMKSIFSDGAYVYPI